MKTLVKEFYNIETLNLFLNDEWTDEKFFVHKKEYIDLKVEVIKYPNDMLYILVYKENKS